jgi:four helix bundle protein
MSGSIDDDVPARAARPLLDAERLDVYRVAVEFQTWPSRLLPVRGQAALRDQLERAAASIVLNVAEGVGRSSRAEKRHFYSVARGSATECAAILDIVLARRLCSVELAADARAPLIRVVQMLTRLIARMGEAPTRPWMD